MIDSKGLACGVACAGCGGGVPKISVANPDDEQEALVDADLDTLATALYVRTDELLKAVPERAPWRGEGGDRPEDQRR